jgi:hypothetical protein
MATIEEQEKLLATLKFTPRTYNISLWGYGGEVAMGTIDRKIFDYFKHRRICVSDYAWDYDAVEELNIPEDMQPFSPGSWYECDNLAHASGVSRSSGNIQVTDENNEPVFESDLESLDGSDVGFCCEDEAWIGMVQPGEVVFIGRSNEKGTFFEGEIDLVAPFDIEKLELHYDEIDGEEIVSSVYYDGEEIDNNGGNTDGKSSEFGFFLVKEDDSWERYVDYDSIDYPMTEWFPKKINPAYLGNYMVKTAGKNSYEYQAKWIGNKWVSAWCDESEFEDPSKEIKIKEWRGIPYNPDAEEWDPAAELDKIIEQHKEVIEQLAEDARVGETVVPNKAAWPF